MVMHELTNHSLERYLLDALPISLRKSGVSEHLKQICQKFDHLGYRDLQTHEVFMDESMLKEVLRLAFPTGPAGFENQIIKQFNIEAGRALVGPATRLHEPISWLEFVKQLGAKPSTQMAYQG